MTDENQAPEVEEKAPKTAKKVVGVTKGAALKVLVDANPKRPGASAYERFENYFKDGIETVQDALDAGVTMGDIKYDIAHEFIDVEGATVEEYIPQSRGSRGSSNNNEVPDDLMEEGSAAEETETEGDLFG